MDITSEAIDSKPLGLIQFFCTYKTDVLTQGRVTLQKSQTNLVTTQRLLNS